MIPFRDIYRMTRSELKEELKVVKLRQREINRLLKVRATILKPCGVCNGMISPDATSCHLCGSTDFET